MTYRFLQTSAIGIALLAILLFAGIRYRLRSMPLERDEGEYAYVGQLMLDGIPPYGSSYTMKLPGTAAAYAVFMKLWGEKPGAIHFGLLVMNIATALLLFLLCRRLYGDVAAGVAAAAYALLSTTSNVLGLAAHAAHFVVFAAIIGLLVLQKAISSSRIWILIVSGLLFGVAGLMKQPGFVFLAFGALYLLWADRSRPLPARLTRVALFSLAGVLPFAALCLLLFKLGVFHKFWFWVFTYASQYGSEVNRAYALYSFKRAIQLVVLPLWWFWGFAVVGLTAPLWCKRARQHAFFITLLLLLSFLGVSSGFYYREHYFVLLLPVVAMLIGVAVSCATDKLMALRSGKVLAALPLAVFMAAFWFGLAAQWDFFFRVDPMTAVGSIYWSTPFTVAPDVAAYLRRLTPPDARIAVLGSEPEIYFYAHRRSATGYLYMYPLLESHKYVRQMQDQMIAEVEAANPEYLIYVDNPTSWAPTPPDMYVLDWVKRYLQQNCELVAVERGTSRAMHLPETDSMDPPLTSYNIYVYKRKGA